MQLIQLSDEDLKKLFFDVEMGLCEHSSLTESEFYSLLPAPQHIQSKHSDQEIFWNLIPVYGWLALLS